jgi:hypothetical protein
MSTCMEASQLIARPDGPRLITTAVRLALDAARADIETECVLIMDGGTRYWDVDSGLFSGSCDNDLEFRQMRQESVQFLDDMGHLARHPEHPNWITFTHQPA